jgi:hypothetical protein
MACPFTGKKSHNTTENGQTGGGSSCPLDTTTEGHTYSSAHGIDIDEIDETNPTLAEYKKLKRVMGIMTQFYKDGTELKRGHYEHVTGELAKLDTDLRMLEEQIQTLEKTPSFAGHPKQKSYLSDLNEEKERLIKQRELFTTKQTEYRELTEWSKGIVQVCEWLELNLDEYCSKTLDYPKLKDCKPAPKLDKEIALRYTTGLDEIYHNLEESQDFFEASIDGRLQKYHTLEKNMIEAQLEVIRKYPETNARRQHVEAELLQDLEFVKGNMVETPDALKRREKMLSAHADFFKVLKFHKEKLRVLYIDEDSSEAQKREFDPRYDHYKD